MYRLVLFIIFMMFFANQSVFAWQISVENKRVLPKDAGTYEYITANQIKHFPVDIDFIVLNKNHYKADLVSQNWQNAKPLAQLSEDLGAFVAVNGGFYRENFLPNGLLILNGVQKSRFVSNDLLSAVVHINKAGVINIFSKKIYESDDKKDLFSAFQAGPLLYHKLKTTNIDSDKLRQRSILIEFENGDIGICYFSPVTLTQMLSILTKIVKNSNLTILHATNLDGGIASSFVVNFNKDPIIRLENQPVKMGLLFFIQ